MNFANILPLGFVKIAAPAITVIASIVFFLTRLLGGEKADAIIEAYDPQKNVSYLVPVYKFGRSIYASKDGKYIAIVPSTIKSTDLYIYSGKNKFNKLRAFKVVKLGDFYGWVEPISSIGISAASREVSAESVSDLIYYMYKAKEVNEKLPISPNTEIYIAYDGKKLAETAIDLYDVAAEESITSIAAITGKLKEFKDYVKLKMELENVEVKKTLAKGTIILAVLMIIGVIIAIITGGH